MKSTVNTMIFHEKLPKACTEQYLILNLMSFFKPKKNLCDICHRYENSPTEEKIGNE